MNIEELNAVTDDARRWHGVRGMLNGRPRRKPLRMDTLGDCISALEEYRGLLNRIDTALTVMERYPEVVSFIESLRDGPYPLRVRDLQNRLALSRGGWQ